MNAPQNKSVNTKPAMPYLAFLKESATFHRAIVYLISAHLAAVQGADDELVDAHSRLADKVAPTYKDPRSYFVSRLFITHIAAFEIFLQDTLSEVIRKHPKKVGDVEFRLADILDSSSNEELVNRALDEHLNRLMYKKPIEYLKEICALLSIEKMPLEDDWKVLVEAKARRDLGVHNAWKCNGIYLRKTQEAGILSGLSIGDSAVPQDEEYINRVGDALDVLAGKISKSVLQKHWPELAAIVADEENSPIPLPLTTAPQTTDSGPSTPSPV